MLRSFLATTFAAMLLLAPPAATASTVTLDDVFADGRAVVAQDVTVTPTAGVFSISGASGTGFAVGPALAARVDDLTLTASVEGDSGGITSASFSVVSPLPYLVSGGTPSLLDARITPGRLDLLFGVAPFSTARSAFGSPVILTLEDDAITPQLLTQGGDEFSTGATVSSVGVVPLPAPALLLLAGLGALGLAARRRRASI